MLRLHLLWFNHWLFIDALEAITNKPSAILKNVMIA